MSGHRCCVGQRNIDPTPARPASQQVIGAAIRAEEWAAIPARSSNFSISSSDG